MIEIPWVLKSKLLKSSHSFRLWHQISSSLVVGVVAKMPTSRWSSFKSFHSMSSAGCRYVRRFLPSVCGVRACGVRMRNLIWVSSFFTRSTHNILVGEFLRMYRCHLSFQLQLNFVWECPRLLTLHWRLSGVEFHFKRDQNSTREHDSVKLRPTRSHLL